MTTNTVGIQIETRADLKGIFATQAALKTLDRQTRLFSKGLRGVAAGLGRFVKLIGKISFVGMAVDIGLVSAAILSVRLAMAAANWTMRAWNATIRGLGVAAGGLAVILGTVAASVREFAELNMAPLVGGLREARQIIRSGLADDLISIFGIQGVQAAMGELARSGVSARYAGGYTNILEQIGKFAAGDATALSQLAALYGEVQRQGVMTQDVLARLIQVAPQFAAAIVELQTGIVKGIGPIVEDEAMKLAEAGEISAEEFAQLFTGKLESLNLFEGMLEKLNQTLVGQVKGLVARLAVFFADVGMPFLEDAKKTISSLEYVTKQYFLAVSGPLMRFAVESFLPGIESGYERFLRWSVRTMVEGMEKIEGFMTRMRNMWWGVKDWFIDVARTFEPLVEGGKILGQVLGPAFKEIFGGAGIGSFIKEFNQLLVGNAGIFTAHGEELRRFVKGFMDIFREGQQAFVGMLPAINKFLAAWTESIWPLLKDMMSVFKEAVAAVLPGLADAFRAVSEVLRPLLQLLKEVIQLGPQMGGSLGGLLTGGAFLAAPWLLGLVGRGKGALGAGAAATGIAATGAARRTWLSRVTGVGGEGQMGLMQAALPFLGMAMGGGIGTAAGGGMGGLIGGFGGLVGGAALGFLPRVLGIKRNIAALGTPEVQRLSELAGIRGMTDWSNLNVNQAARLNAEIDAYRNTLPSGQYAAWQGRTALNLTPEQQAIIRGRLPEAPAASLGQQVRDAFGPRGRGMLRGTGGIGLMMLAQQMPAGSLAQGVMAGAGMGGMVGSFGGLAGQRFGAGIGGWSVGQALGEWGARSNQRGAGVALGGLTGAATGAMVGGLPGAIIGGIAGLFGAGMGLANYEKLREEARQKAQEVGDSFTSALEESLREGGGQVALDEAGEALTELMKNAASDAKQYGIDVETYTLELEGRRAELEDMVREREEDLASNLETLARITGKGEEELAQLADTLGVDLTSAALDFRDALVDLKVVMAEGLGGDWGRAQASVEVFQDLYSQMFEAPGTAMAQLKADEIAASSWAYLDEIAAGMLGGTQPSSQQLESVLGAWMQEASGMWGLEGPEAIPFLVQRAAEADAELRRRGLLGQGESLLTKYANQEELARAAFYGTQVDQATGNIIAPERLTTLRGVGATYYGRLGLPESEMEKIITGIFEQSVLEPWRMFDLITEQQDAWERGITGLEGAGQQRAADFARLRELKAAGYAITPEMQYLAQNWELLATGQVLDEQGRDLQQIYDESTGALREFMDQASTGMLDIGAAARGVYEALEGAGKPLATAAENAVGYLDSMRGPVSFFNASMSLLAARMLNTALPGIPTDDDTSSPRGPLGDTASARFRRAMGFHSAISAGIAGGRTITSGIRGWGLGSLMSDHRFGRAYDLVGDNLGQYALAVNSLGGFSEFHGAAGSRHLHVVAPVGDSRSPARMGGVGVPGIGAITVNINGANANPEEIANRVITKIRRLQKSAQERA